MKLNTRRHTPTYIQRLALTLICWVNQDALILPTQEDPLTRLNETRRRTMPMLVQITSVIMNELDTWRKHYALQYTGIPHKR